MSEHNEEIIHAGFISLLAEAVAVTLFIGMIAVWAALGAGA